MTYIYYKVNLSVTLGSLFYGVECWSGILEWSGVKFWSENVGDFGIHSDNARSYFRPEVQWSCIPQLSAEDMLKSVVIEENKFKNI